MKQIGAIIVASAILTSPFLVEQASASPLSLGARAIPAAADQTAIIVPVFRGGGARGGGFRGGAAMRGGVGVRRGGAVAIRGGAVGGGARRGGAVAWRRPANYWWRPGGAIAAGAAIGVVGAATAAAWAGAAPAPNSCWYYTDQSRRQGFWDVCS
jgi:hypothetical protein